MEEGGGVGGRYLVGGVTTPCERAVDGREEKEADGDDGADGFTGALGVGDATTRLNVACRAGKEDIL